MGLLTFPDSRLREKSREIKPSEIVQLKSLILDMIETRSATGGIGLAAPQIGRNVRLAVISKEATADGREWILINPKIIKRSWRKIKELEGCLSVPGVQKEISRYKKITIRALDGKGQPLNFSASDLFARVIQHEIDHLDGILIVDK